MSSEDDSALVLQGQNGDAEAFGVLTERYQEMIKRRVGAVLGEGLRPHTEDIVQDALIRAWEKIGSFKFDGPDSFPKWVTTIAIRKCIDLQKKKRARDSVFDEDHGASCHLMDRGLEGLFESAEVGPLHEMVGRVMVSLDYDCRILLIASIAYKIPPVEVARMTRDSLGPGTSGGFGAEMQQWIAGLFGGLERTMKERRDHCWDVFRERLDKLSPRRVTRSTKKESRGGTNDF